MIVDDNTLFPWIFATVATDTATAVGVGVGTWIGAWGTEKVSAVAKRFSASPIWGGVGGNGVGALSVENVSCNPFE